MEDKYMAVAFTGHRPETIPYINDFNSEQYFDLQKAVWKEIQRYVAYAAEIERQNRRS